MGRDTSHTGQKGGKADAGIAALKARNGVSICISKGKRDVLICHYCKPGTLAANGTLDAEFEKEIKGGGRGERRCIRDRRQCFRRVTKTVLQEGYRGSSQGNKVKKCAATLGNRKAAGAELTEDELMKYGGEAMLLMMVMLYKWVWKNEYPPQWWTEGVVLQYSC